LPEVKKRLPIFGSLFFFGRDARDATGAVAPIFYLANEAVFKVRNHFGWACHAFC
jgi:hypothetical protein